ncbi:hypothetical protein [Leifsonia sp. Leaf264]|uniref:hypothetical protein n=1 Tax=Leifsonia sp. Leaf264 TaxID=1736314 RepID=UPI0006F7B756|nr:hypothetical protein [Leifsonia sp. Leaf264]KQO95842.1 hypothetical protein ASF30_19860 [Leifsonia sp. Leaf264]
MLVDYGQLSLVQQVVERQGAVHAAGMVRYVRAECEIAPFDLGLLLVALYPLNQVVVEVGAQVFTGLEALTDAVARTLTATMDEYADADRAAAEAVAALMQALGASAPPYRDPTANLPALGAAQGSAPSSYGEGEGNILSQAADEGGDLREYLEDRANRAGDRLSSITGSGSGVVERVDVSSYLVPPVGATSEIEEMRWSCGVIIGGIDWVFEKIFGFSFIAEVIMKPFRGDWEAIDRASIAWGHLADANREMAGNFSGLVDGTRFWEGEAGDAYRNAMAALSAALLGLATACESASSMVGMVGTVSKLAAATIGFAINQISIKLLRIAAEAAIPVAGWIAAAAEIAVTVYQIVGILRMIYAVVDAIFDAIYDAVAAREALVDVALIVEDLVAYYVRAGAKAVTA